MKDNREGLDRHYLREIINARASRKEVLHMLGVSKSRLERLLDGNAEFSLSEMLRCAAILELNECEFSRCFFTAKSSENLN